MFQVMTDDLVFSSHETKAAAENSIENARARTQEAIKILFSEIREHKEFLAGLFVVENDE